MPTCSPAWRPIPYFGFTTTAVETGEVVFTWTDDRGDVTTERRTLTVT